MSRSKGLLNISANFEPQIAEPFDGRMRVGTMADLLLASTWRANNNIVYTYPGMIVSVYGDTTPENNGVYMLLQSDYTNILNWKNLSYIDLSLKQDVTDNDLETTSKTVVGAINEVRSFALNIEHAKAFDTEALMDAWLLIPENVSLLKIGMLLLIRDVSVPDYWWDGTEALELEVKIDLSGYYTSDEVDDLLDEKQNITDNDLETTSKTVVGAINELKSTTEINVTQDNLPSTASYKQGDEWVDSATLTKYTLYDDGLTKQWVNFENGQDGLSAYQIWINLGNTGSEQDFIDSLGSGIESITGDGVDNTDPLNPVLGFPNADEIDDSTTTNKFTSVEELAGKADLAGATFSGPISATLYSIAPIAADSVPNAPAGKLYYFPNLSNNNTLSSKDENGVVKAIESGKSDRITLSGTASKTLNRNENLAIENVLVSTDILTFSFENPTSGGNNSYYLNLTVGATSPTINFNIQKYSGVGTISVSGTTVTGIGTRFLTDFRVGRNLLSNGGAISKVIASIGSDTAMAVTVAYSSGDATNTNATGAYTYGDIWWQNGVVPTFLPNTKYQIIFDFIEEESGVWKLKAVIGAF